MSYWSRVLAEVLNKHDPLYAMAFTNVREYGKLQEVTLNEAGKADKKASTSTHAAKKHTQIAGTTKKYTLGEKFPNVYLTRREAQIMFYFIHGMSTGPVASLLDLSRRTVEFYINNMKIKLGCQFKSELIGKIMDSDFLKLVDFKLKA